MSSGGDALFVEDPQDTIRNAGEDDVVPPFQPEFLEADEAFTS